MILFIVLGGLVLVGVAVLLSYLGDTLEDTPEDAPDAGLPDRQLVADDIPRLRFRVGLRGYRMSDVDAALDRVEAALREAQTPSAVQTPTTTSKQP